MSRLDPATIRRKRAVVADKSPAATPGQGGRQSWYPVVVPFGPWRETVAAPTPSTKADHRVTDTDCTVGDEGRHFEDYLPGSVAEYGAIDVTADEIVAFGRRFDPQPFHIDEDFATRSDFGGLIASGWHTASLMMRLLVDNFLSKMAGLGSPGIDQLRWLAPVRPGDRLSIRVRIDEARRLRSRPDRGMFRLAIEVLNQQCVVVMTVNALTLVRCRDTTAQPHANGDA